MTKKQILTKIAKKHCFVETLDRRGRDSLDFHDIHVAGLKAALEEAFEAGQANPARKSSYDPSDEVYWK